MAKLKAKGPSLDTNMFMDDPTIAAQSQERVANKARQALIDAEFGGTKSGRWKGLDDPEFARLQTERDLADGVGIRATNTTIFYDDEEQDEAVEVYVPELRDYQEAAIRRTLWAISSKNPKGTRSAAAIMATGTGKTITFSELARRCAKIYKRRVLIVCHQIEIVDQWIDTLKRLGIPALREQGVKRASEMIGTVKDVVVVACVDSLTGDRLTVFGENFFDLCIHDECDLALSATWGGVIDFFSGARHIGVTATPDLTPTKRKKKRTIKERFETIAFTYRMTTAINEGWLVRPIERRAKHKEIDLTQLRITANDFNKGDLDDIIVRNVGALAEASIPLMRGKPTIAFTPTIFTAQALAAAFDALGVPAVAISGKTKAKERKQIFKDFEAGKYLVLCNCSLITRGVDVPCAENVIMARPTASRALWVQMVGRVLRPYHNEATGYRKEAGYIINFAWRFQKANHKLQHPVDLFRDSDIEEEVIEMAIKMYDAKVAEDPDAELDPEEFIKDAEEFINAQIKERLRFRVQEIIAQVTTLDPLAMEIMDVPVRKANNWASGKPITAAQKQALLNSGYDEEYIAGIDMRICSDLLDAARERREKGLCTWRQMKSLIKCGVDIDEANNYGFGEATAYLDINLPRQSWWRGGMGANGMRRDSVIQTPRQAQGIEARQGREARPAGREGREGR